MKFCVIVARLAQMRVLFSVLLLLLGGHGASSQGLPLRYAQAFSPLQSIFALPMIVAEREGSMCVRFFRRTDGTVLTADCPVGTKRKRGATSRR